MLGWRLVAKDWAQAVDGSLLAQLRRLDFHVMLLILFHTAQSLFGASNGVIADNAARLFAGCESLAIAQNQSVVPLWLIKAVPRLPRLHSLWIETHRWPAEWTPDAMPALRRLALHNFGKPDTVQFPPPLETLWIVGRGLMFVGSSSVASLVSLARLKHYHGPHAKEELTGAQKTLLSYSQCLDRRTRTRPQMMKAFIAGCDTDVEFFRYLDGGDNTTNK
jgi:hypothetical protein